MKKVVIALAIVGGVALPASALALSGPLSGGKYCYPTSSYWQKQLSNPWNAAFYAHHPEYAAKYGPTSHYCI